MKISAQKAERHSRAETTRRFVIEKRAIILYFCIIALSLIVLLTSAAQSIWETYFQEMDAVTTPFGVIYFKEDLPEWVYEHEQCHVDRLEEIGALRFYADYLLGGACAEELRCGSTLEHPACSEYPLSHVPPKDIR